MKTLIFSNLRFIIAVMAMVFGLSTVYAQIPKTDTVYHQMFGCDSLVLEANGQTYRTNTVVEIPHRATAQGIVYIDVLNVYNIEIGRSYNVRRTVNASVCSNALPYAYRGHFFYKSGTYQLQFPSVKGCDSLFVTLNLNVMNGTRDTAHLGICSNESSTQYDDITFDTPGVFDFIQGYDQQGCPIVKTYIVEVYPTDTKYDTTIICQNALPYIYKGQEFSQAGTYTVSHQTEQGCNTTTQFTLIVNPSSRIRESYDTTVCVSELPFVLHGISYKMPGVYAIPILNQYGCDSVFVFLRLNVSAPVSETISVSLCKDDLPYHLDSVNVFNDFGDYYLPKDGTVGCSDFTHVVIDELPSVDDTIKACTNDDYYVFYNEIFTSTGTYTVRDTNQHQCVDKHTVILTVKPEIVLDTVYKTICETEIPFTFHGSKYYSSGNYNKIIQNAEGCDSARIRLVLTVNNNPKINDTVTITRNELPYHYRDSVYTASGVYSFHVPDSHNGCDTIVTLKLNVIPVVNVEKDTTVCANVPVEYLGVTITTAGPHKFTYHLPEYDSVITLNVNHLPTYRNETFSINIGEYDLPYRYGDVSYTEAGIYEQSLTTVNGCDSVISFILSVTPAIINNDTIVRELCSNELPIIMFDSVLTEGGVHRFLTRSMVSSSDSVFYVRLNVKESPALVIPDTAYKCADRTVIVTAQSTGSVYLWSNGATTQSIEASLAGNYSVTASNAYGCSATASVSVIDAENPTVGIEGNFNICRGSSTTLKATGGVSYLWSNETNTDTVVLTPTQTTAYTVTATNKYGCSQTRNITVTVNELPQPEITGNNNICANKSTTFIASGGETYLWSNSSTADRITVSTQGIYSVTATDANGCKNSVSVNLTVNQLPDIRILGRNTFCQGSSTTLTASGGSSYEWESGETSQSITVHYAGTYTVTGTDQNGCSASKSLQVSRDDVNATISGSRYFCHGSSTTLVVSDLGNYTYRWYDGSTASSITVSSPGAYSVTVTNPNGCQNTLSATVSEYSMPMPAISGNLTICEGQSTTLRASGGTSYIWDDGSTAALKSNVNATGTYTVTASNQYGCTASTSVSVLVNPAPTVSILSNDNICRGETVSITAISPEGRTFNWASGQSQATISVSPTYNTTYTVLVTDENNCSTTASKTIVVNQPPAVYIEGNLTICSGDTATLSVAEGNTYLWNTGAISSSIKVTNPNIYTVTVTNSQGCSAVSNANVIVNALPTASVTETAEICAGAQAVLVADAQSGSSYTWSTGSHQSQVSVNTAGTYTVTITGANQCSKTYQCNVLVRNLPQVNIMGNSEMCYGSSTILTASAGTDMQYIWSTGESNPTIVVSTAGNYTVTATNMYNCSATATRTVVVNQPPTPQITGVLSVCRGASTTLTADGGVMYQWNNGEQTSGNSITVTPQESKSYTVTATNAYGCTATASANVVVNDLPTITFSGATTICEGSVASITATGAVNYSWSTGQSTPTAQMTSQGTYYVTASNSSNCVNTDSVYITVNPNPNVVIGGDDHICANTISQLTASGAQSYTWNTEETSQTIIVNPSVSTTFSVTGYDVNGCSSTAVKNIVVEPLPQVEIIGQKTICREDTTTLTVFGGNTYQWNTGSTAPNIVMSPSITTTYTVTAFSSFGCQTVSSATINVNSLPTINFSGATSICEGQITSIYVSGATNYSWSDGSTGSMLTTGTPGTYTVIATNSLNCQRKDSITIVVWDNPTIGIAGQDLICEGSANVLTASGAENYVWSTNENTSSITVMPTATQTYSVTGFDSHGCSSTVSKVVNVEALPNVNISGMLAICNGETTTLTASGGQTYLWSTGSTEASITVGEYGSYSVTATTSDGCSAAESVVVVNNPVPVYTLTGDSIICENTTKTLAVTGDYDYLWSNGSTGKEITISTGGVYSVVATNDYGCSVESSINVSTLAAPFVQVIGVSELCALENTTLVASSNAHHFEWSTGDSTQTINVIPDNTTYTVTVTGDNGCLSETQHTIVSLPIYNITVTGEICENNSYNQYDFETPVMDSAGVFTFTRHLQTASGCDSTVNLLLTVNPKPRLDSINGPAHIIQYGNSFYSVNNPQFVDNYEWRVSNTHWQILNPNFEIATLSVNTNGTGILTARGINNCGYTETSLSLFCNVGIEDPNTSFNISLYPNPIHQTLFVNIDNRPDVRRVMMYDMSGKLVYGSNITDSNFEIDCTVFANGNYTIVFYDDKGNKTESRKIIIQNR